MGHPNDESRAKQDAVRQLANGLRTSLEISQMTRIPTKYVQKIMLKFDLPRLKQGARLGEDHRDWKGGRHVDLDGYILIKAPDWHANAHKHTGLVYEHRFVVESKLERYLSSEEVVDHIDGSHLHNHESNLRVFASNADHLRATISGQVPNWSQEGLARMRTEMSQRANLKQVDIYQQKKECGDVRLQQILRALLQFGKDSPYLLGTLHWLEQAEIVDLSENSLKYHLELLNQKWPAGRWQT